MIDDEIQTEAREVVAELGDAEAAGLIIRTAQGEVALPAELSSLVVGIVHKLATGEAMGMQTLPAELTTTTAAERLGISRPTLMKLVRSGELESYKVGSHTRIKTAVVREYARERQLRRQAALSKMLEIDAQYTDDE